MSFLIKRKLNITNNKKVGQLYNQFEFSFNSIYLF